MTADDGMLELVCRACGAGFTAPRQRRGPRPRYCSAGCRRRGAEAARKPRARACVACGEAFSTHTARKTCSDACAKARQKPRSDLMRSANAALRNSRNCVRCGAGFTVHLSAKGRLGLSREGTYCSRKCQAAATRKYATKADAKHAEYQRRKARLNATAESNSAVGVGPGPGNRAAATVDSPLPMPVPPRSLTMTNVSNPVADATAVDLALVIRDYVAKIRAAGAGEDVAREALSTAAVSAMVEEAGKREAAQWLYEAGGKLEAQADLEAELGTVSAPASDHAGLHATWQRRLNDMATIVPAKDAVEAMLTVALTAKVQLEGPREASRTLFVVATALCADADNRQADGPDTRH